MKTIHFVIGGSRRRVHLSVFALLAALVLWPLSDALALSTFPASRCWPTPLAGEAPQTLADDSCPPFPWVPITVDGEIVKDFEIQGPGTDDPSNGGTGFNGDHVDMSSGFLPGTTDQTPPGNCFPQDGERTNCGTEPSGFWTCANVRDDTGVATGNIGTLRTRMYLRMRVNALPISNNTFPATDSKPGLKSVHWNHLLSTNTDEGDPDFKEFWIDLEGEFTQANSVPDRVRIIYENNAGDNSPNAATAANCSGAGCGPTAPTGTGNGTGAFINQFTACARQGLTPCQFNNREVSHARAVHTGTTGDDPNEYWVDMQVPLWEGPYTPTDLVNMFPWDASELALIKFVATENTMANFTPGNTGTWPNAVGETITQRGRVVISGCDLLNGPQSTTKYNYSTSNSNTNPIQKDSILTGFSDITFASISYFHATRSNAGVRFEWQTGAELMNLGFDIYEDSGNGWRKLNPSRIASKVGDSVTPTDYTYDGPATTATRFLLADVDTNLKSHRNGPYTIDLAYGTRVDPEPIDWASIVSQHDDKKKIRISKQQDVLKKHLGQLKKSSETTTLASNNSPSAATAGAQALLDVGVEQNGIHRITYAQLLAAGIDLAGVRGKEIALTYRGSPVPIRVEPSGNRKFNSSGYIEFVGKAPQSLYTRTNVYQLHLDESLALGVGEESGSTNKKSIYAADYPETVLVDKNLAYSFTSPNGEDPWFEADILTAWVKPAMQSFTIELDDLVPNTPATLSLNVWARGDYPADPDHRLIVEFNGTQLADETFDGNVDIPLSFDLPPGLAQPGSNTLKLTVPGDVVTDDPNYYDWFRVNTYGVSYARNFVARDGTLGFTSDGDAFQVDNIGAGDAVAYRVGTETVTYLAGTKVSGGAATFPGSGGPAQYYVASVDNLLSPSLSPALPLEDISSGNAAYLVIAHPDFLSGAARADVDRLVAERTSQTYASAKVVDVEQIYAQFAGANLDPAAITEYIQYAATNLGTTAVLLIGGDTYDYKNYTGSSSYSFIPTLFVDGGGGFLHTPSDPKYADINGDDVADVDIGRLPVRTDSELNILVNKTLNYVARGNKVVFVADKLDPVANFAETSDSIAAEVPATAWTVEKVYLDTEVDASTARSKVQAAFNAGDAALISYIGHSGPTRWAYSNPALLDSGNAAAINTSGAASVVTQWGCWMDHLNPAYNTLTHKLLFNPNGGAAAVFGMSSANSAGADAQLAPLAQRAMMTPNTTLGAALTSAKQSLAPEVSQLRDVMLGGMLLGDPGLKVAR